MWAATSRRPSSGSPWARGGAFRSARPGGTSRPTRTMTSRRPAAWVSRPSSSSGRTRSGALPRSRPRIFAPSLLPLDEAPEHEGDVGRPLGEAAHEVGHPLRAEGDVDADPVPLPRERLLQVAPHAEEHLCLPVAGLPPVL